ncbi:MAG: glycosyltransferase family 1 protein [Alphaproteobacteria bacterium]|nr:glycosyltransferase family 1 protein [Alphaproteobacteria bacterium]
MIIDVTRPLFRSLRDRLPTGIDRIVLAYISYYHDKARALAVIGDHWIVFDKRASSDLFDNLISQRSRTSLCATLARTTTFGRSTFEKDILLNVGHHGLERPGYTAKAKRLGLAPYYFLHDLIPITHPEYSKEGETALHRLRMSEMMQSCGLIINSNATQTILNRYATHIKASVPPCVVAPVGPAQLPPPNLRRPIKRPYFIILGTIEPRKNHLTILHAWRRIVERLGDAAPKLLVIGQRGWDCEQIADLLDRCEQLRGAVIEIPRCPDIDLSTYLRHAQALLFPSFEEGYGMPLVEALTAGTPVLASTLPVFREIAGGVPDYLDPLDGCGWLSAILDYAAHESQSREDQLNRLKSFVAPTWQTHFNKVEAFLNKP